MSRSVGNAPVGARQTGRNTVDNNPERVKAESLARGRSARMVGAVGGRDGKFRRWLIRTPGVVSRVKEKHPCLTRRSTSKTTDSDGGDKMASVKSKHYNYGTSDLTTLVGQPTPGGSRKRKLPAKVIRRFQRRDDRLNMLDAHKPTAYCIRCGTLHNMSFMRFVEGDAFHEDGYICLDCLHPVAD